MNKLPKTLRGKNIYPEGGRSCYFSATYNIARYPLQATWWPEEVELLFYIKDHHNRWYFVSRDESQFVGVLQSFIDSPETRLCKLENDILHFREEFNSLLKTLSVSFTTDSLVDVFETYNKLREQLLATAGCLRYIDRGSIIELKRLLGSSYSDEVLRTVTVSERDTYTQQEQIDILRIASKYEHDKDLQSVDASHALRKLTEKYTYSTLGYYAELPVSEDALRERVQHAMSTNPQQVLKKLKMQKESAVHAKNEYISSFPEGAKRIAHIAAESTFLKDLFKHTLNYGTYLAEPLWEEIARRTHRPVDVLKDYTTAEIVSLLRIEEVDEAEVKARIERSVIVGTKNGIETYLDDDASSIYAQFLTPTSEALVGRSACSGVAKGKARVILNVNDFPKMRDNDIIVAINTSPDYVPIMKRAAAILTEEGGITSHASVVSRELGVPCIVGIPHVTDILKDGMEVEVDANEGVVRILKTK